MAKVSQQQIHAAAVKADVVGEGIAGNLNMLMLQIEAAEQGFRGGGGTAFQNKSQEINNDLKAILNNLRRLSEAAGLSVTDYGTTDTSTATEISKISSQLYGQPVADGLRG